MSKKPVVLMVLDGYGLNDRTEGNAVAMAKTPVMDRLMKECPFAKGNASGLYVGLPDGQMGNSEVGHMNIGAGRIVYQDLTRITKAIEDGDFFKNESLLKAIENCKENNSDLHLWGLLSDGGVHSHLTHIYGLLELAKRQDFDRVYIHAFLDGRDTPPASGKDYVKQLEDKMRELGVGKIASLSGRYYAMDRDTNWDRTKKAYDSLVLGEGVKETDAVRAMENSYKNEVTDEFVLPTVIVDEKGEPLSLVKAKDSVIFFNFRPDRARQITRAFCDPEFKGFEREFMPLTYVCFKNYDETIPNKLIAFEKEQLKNTLGEYLASCGKKQLRLAETEKYAHVTFFFNGGVEEPNVEEKRILVNSPKDVPTYDLKPEMSAPEVGMDLVEAITSGEYDTIIINFANPDMVGHTGVIEAAIKAVERIDELVGDAVEAVKKVDGVMFICADHGNAEKMIDYETGKPHTAHTTNPVPFILVNGDEKVTLRQGGCLADIAPTILELMELEQPKEMTGKSLLVKN
ncbi:MAG: 2,3-bisphosphoglycerate-independent phosphoglycerate mutase [Lachnospiraceae bacterium]|jgi:2,3-bisphosphoglycerate-independent phosphoglycerate mutase|nr:2,3-bisphosphoglycerate-independent phosphoglycerate mutase [Lachnospiraceae bacterium]